MALHLEAVQTHFWYPNLVPKRVVDGQIVKNPVSIPVDKDTRKIANEIEDVSVKIDDRSPSLGGLSAGHQGGEIIDQIEKYGGIPDQCLTTSHRRHPFFDHHTGNEDAGDDDGKREATDEAEVASADGRIDAETADASKNGPGGKVRGSPRAGCEGEANEDQWQDNRCKFRLKVRAS